MTAFADVQEDYDKGLEVYNKNDYATALMLWFPLADRGDIQAQFMLGNMYMQQKGERKDHENVEIS